MRSLVADVLLLIGLAVMTIGVYGVLRLPDVYSQLHAASKAALPGVTALLASAAVEGGGDIVARAVLIVALLTVTTPVAAHAVARAAHLRGEPMSGEDNLDET